MVDISVTSGAAWVCPTRHLADILLPVDVSGMGDGQEESSWSASVPPADDPVLLEQVEEAAPCVLTVHCGATSAVSRLLLVSEARTMEVYSHTGEYCGTVRGERDSGVQAHGAGRGPFYRKQLVLHEPSSSCDVKLLSLAGRSSVLLSRLVVGVQPLTSCPPAAAAAIDMQQVQTLMEEMGSSLSPGAQNLMDMVQLQQKRQTSSLGGLLPLLVGGALPALTLRRSEPSPPAGHQPPHGSPHEAPPAQNGSTPSAAHTPDGTNTTSSRRPLSHTRLEEMMSQLLRGPKQVQASAPAADLLPLLQDVCGQVTQLRMEDAAAEKTTLTNGDVDSAMERRLEEMEQRLKEHVDRRLDALEQKLEKAFFSVLPPRGSAPPPETTAPPPGPQPLT